MQVIDARDPVCDTLAILASILHPCDLSCGATACTCLRISEAAHTGEPIYMAALMLKQTSSLYVKHSASRFLARKQNIFCANLLVLHQVDWTSVMALLQVLWRRNADHRYYKFPAVDSPSSMHKGINCVYTQHLHRQCAASVQESVQEGHSTALMAVRAATLPCSM